MDQDVTWYGARPRPRRLCVRRGPRCPSPKGHSPHPIFGSYLLRPNGCVDQDATGMELGLGPGDVVLDADPAPKFSAHVYCGQTAGWIKMVLGMDVGLSPGDFVLDGDPAPLPQKGAEPLSPIFGPFLL